ncbi:MAG: twin-arginine translocase subunit TatC, partial [Victivallaceae bacterium]|nr:twin-arginine translocase subunit TatC [Victivallaceae bacterium]
MDSPENSKTFLEHLEELRRVIFKILAAVIIVFPAAFYFAGDLIVLLVNHSCPEGFALHYFSPMEPLFVKIKISLLAAFFAALPYVAWEVWKFVVPALYPDEKRVIKRLTLSSWALFLAGVAFCFFFVIPAMMRFSLSMRSDELQPAIGLNNYIGLAGMLLLGFGMMFQLPIVIFFLALSGMIQIKTINKFRQLFMIVILTLSALLTP